MFRRFIFLFVLAGCAVAARSAESEPGIFTGQLSSEFENAYLSTSGTLCDTRPTSLQNLDWDLSLGRYGHFWGYGAFLSMLHDKQSDLHRMAFNEFETGVFYGYDWKLNDDFIFSQSAGGVWNPLFGYRHGNDETLWEYRYFQSLENPWLTPFWDILGMISPTPDWARIRFGVRRTFALGESFLLTPTLEAVWGDGDRFSVRYGEKPNDEFLNGALVTTTAGIKLEWRLTERWSVWAKVRQLDTINHQARRLEKAKTVYWAKPDYTIFTLGCGCRF